MNNLSKMTLREDSESFVETEPIKRQMCDGGEFALINPASKAQYENTPMEIVQYE